MAHLLQDPRGRATVNMQDRQGNTVLHYACDCDSEGEEAAAPTVHLLLQADADPTIPDDEGITPLDVARPHRPKRHVIALFEQALAEAEKTSLLDKARRLAVAASSNAVAPSCL